MIVFQLLVFPGLAIFIFTFQRVELQGWREQLLLYAKGMVLFLPVAVLLLFLVDLAPPSYRPFNLYLYALISEHLIHYLVVAGGFCLFYGIYRLSEVQILDYCSFASGYFTLLSLQLILSSAGQHQPYQLFLLPLTRGAMVLLSSYLFVKILETYGFAKAAFISAFSVIPFLTACILNESTCSTHSIPYAFEHHPRSSAYLSARGLDD